MKKILMLLMVCFLVLTGCNSPKSESKFIKQEYIQLDTLKQKIEKKESFIFVVSSLQCSYCKKLTEMLDKFESSETIYKFEVTKATKEQINELVKMYPGLNATPTSFFYKEGELKETISGFEENQMKTKITEFFKK